MHNIYCILYSEHNDESNTDDWDEDDDDVEGKPYGYKDVAAVSLVCGVVTLAIELFLNYIS